jgi:hypothetical protein
MPKRKSVALYRKNLFPRKNNEEEHEQWLYSYSEFDRNGKQTEQSVYAQDGTLVERTLMEYDANGFVICEKYFVDRNGPSEEKQYVRDDKGLILKELKLYTDGSCDTTVYEYDSQYRIVSKITFDDEDEREQEVTHEYRDDFLLRTHVFDGDRNLLKLDEFKYDEKGNSVEHKLVDNEAGNSSFIVTAYNSHGRKKEETRYDEDGGMIHQTFYEEDDQGRLHRITEEGKQKGVTISFTYDEEGNAVFQEECDHNGKQMVSVKRRFDKDNNLTHSEVFIDGQGLTLPQHYEIMCKYEFYDE